MNPIQKAITSAGYHDGPARQVVVALEQFYAAFNGRDLARMAAH